MTCPHCHAEIPSNKLVCDCFQVQGDNELQDRTLKLFVADRGYLFVTRAATSGHHLLPTARNCLALCHKKRFQRADVSVIDIRQFRDSQIAVKQTPGSPPDRFCKACAEVVNAAIARGAV
jgi:hypothetical protein